MSVSNKKSCFIPKKPRLIPRGEKSILFVVFAFFRQSLRNIRKGIFGLGGGLNVVRAVFVHRVKHVLGLARYGSGARGRAVALGNLFSFILVRFHSSFLVRILYLLLFPPIAEIIYLLTNFKEIFIFYCFSSPKYCIIMTHLQKECRFL